MQKHIMSPLVTIMTSSLTFSKCIKWSMVDGPSVEIVYFWAANLAKEVVTVGAPKNKSKEKPTARLHLLTQSASSERTTPSLSLSGGYVKLVSV